MYMISEMHGEFLREFAGRSADSLGEGCDGRAARTGRIGNSYEWKCCQNKGAGRVHGSAHWKSLSKEYR